MVKKLAAAALRKAADFCEPETGSKKEGKLSTIQVITLILAIISVVLIFTNLIYDIVNNRKNSCDDDFDDDFDDFDDDLDYDPSELYDDMTDAE